MDVCLAKEASNNIETSSVKQYSVYTQLFMKGGGSKNKFTDNNVRVNSATPGFLGMLSGSSCNKNNN